MSRRDNNGRDDKFRITVTNSVDNEFVEEEQPLPKKKRKKRRDNDENVINMMDIREARKKEKNKKRIKKRSSVRMTVFHVCIVRHYFFKSMPSSIPSYI